MREGLLLSLLADDATKSLSKIDGVLVMCPRPSTSGIPGDVVSVMSVTGAEVVVEVKLQGGEVGSSMEGASVSGCGGGVTCGAGEEVVSIISFGGVELLPLESEPGSSQSSIVES